MCGVMEDSRPVVLPDKARLTSALSPQEFNPELLMHHTLLIDAYGNPLLTPDDGIVAAADMVERLNEPLLQTVVPGPVYWVGDKQTRRIPLVASVKGVRFRDGDYQAVPAISSRRVRIRDMGVDMYSGKLIEDKRLATWDHIVPRAVAPELGKDWSNGVTTLFSTNNKKGERLNRECGLKLVWGKGERMWEPTRNDLWWLRLKSCSAQIPAEWKPYLARFMEQKPREECFHTAQIYAKAAGHLEQEARAA